MRRTVSSVLLLLAAACAPLRGAAPPLIVRLPAGEVHGTIEVPPGGVLEGAEQPGLHLEMPATTIVGPETGPAVRLGAGAVARHLRIAGRDASESAAAVLVEGHAARLEHCAVTGPATGILVLRGEADVVGCDVSSLGTGIAARASRLRLDGTQVRGSQTGIDVEEGSRLAMASSHLTGVLRDGLVIGALSSAVVETSVIENCRRSGCNRLFSSSSLILRSSRLANNGVDILEPTAVAPAAQPAESSADVAATLREGRALLQILAPRPADIETMVAPALAEIGFSATEVALPTDRLRSLPPILKACLDSPLAAAGTVDEVARGLGQAATPQAMLERIGTLLCETAPGYGRRASLDEALTSAHDLVESLPFPEELESAFLDEEPDPTLWEEHNEAAAVRRLSRTLGDRARQVPVNRLLAAAMVLLDALERDSRPADRSIAAPAGISGRIEGAWRTSAGWMVIGSEEDNTYAPGIAVIVDLGGDDRYADPARVDSGVAIVLDFGGDDRYEGRICSARRGLAMLIDLGGDDAYEGEAHSCAAATSGLALLWDEAGNDRYRSGTAGQGFGLAGAGLLVDRSGDDYYEAGSFSQAVAGPNGIGILLDRSGHDRYALIGGSADAVRDPAQRLSFGQGFAMGLRPGSAGGVALLLDGAGNDDYACGLFGQGAGYWASLGAIWDDGGDDIYRGRQYVQGAGVHLAAGLLIDRTGRDLYQAFTCAQGCGHDYSLGLLYDGAGPDLYRSDNLSQGCGNLNGLGVLVDASGEDQYVLESHNLGQGWGVYEAMFRRFGSLGILVDRGGRDLYSGPGRDGTSWQQGEIGIGRDEKEAEE